MCFIHKEVTVVLSLLKEPPVLNNKDWAVIRHTMHTLQSQSSMTFFLKLYKFFFTSFQSEAIQPFTACVVVKTALYLRRFWLQFSTEDGPGPGSAFSIDNISFSMDCFLACEYYTNVKSFFFHSYIIRPWLNQWDFLTAWLIDLGPGWIALKSVNSFYGLRDT